MTLEEVKASIEASIKARDFMYEHTPANYMLLSKHFGTFQAVESGRGEEKYLIPEVGTVHFLYRGQNIEKSPCIPTIYRGEPDDAQVFTDRMRLTVFKRLLASHPVVEHFFKRHHFVVNEEGLAQHYGLRTEILDLTSNLDVAIFFAICKYNPKTDAYDYFREDGKAVLYVFDPVLDNEPSPSLRFDRYMNGNIKPIGLQAFPRPGAQSGYGLRISKGESTKSWMFEFSFTAEESKAYYEKFKAGEALWIKDRMINKSKTIAEQMVFSRNVFDETYTLYRPKGYSKTKLKAALKGVTLEKDVPDVLFTQEERREIVEEWNDHIGAEMAKIIVRKPWFLHEGTEKNTDGTEQIVGIHDRHDHLTLQKMGETVMLMFMAEPSKMDGAVWRNYTGLPRPQEHNPYLDGKWRKMDASMMTVFGKPYMEEDDWWIEIS